VLDIDAEIPGKLTLGCRDAVAVTDSALVSVLIAATGTPAFVGSACSPFSLGKRRSGLDEEVTCLATSGRTGGGAGGSEVRDRRGH
jgi:hypothetical protein